MDGLVERLTRSVAQRTSRRSFLVRLGQLAMGGAMLPLLPIDRVTSKAGAQTMSEGHSSGGEGGDTTTGRAASPARLTIYDAPLDPESITAQMRENLDDEITEVKSENAIDRITSQANPRTLERVPAGARFKIRMVLDVLCEEDKALAARVFEGLRLLEPETTLRDALSAMLVSSVQLGAVVDERERVLGLVSVDQISEVLQSGELPVRDDAAG